MSGPRQVVELCQSLFLEDNCEPPGVVDHQASAESDDHTDDDVGGESFFLTGVSEIQPKEVIIVVGFCTHGSDAATPIRILTRMARSTRFFVFSGKETGFSVRVSECLGQFGGSPP